MSFALISVGVAVVPVLAVDPYGIGVRFSTLWPAVIITALIGGLGAGLFSLARSVVATGFLALPPPPAVYIEDRADLADFGQYDPRRLLGSGDVRLKKILDVSGDEIPGDQGSGAS
jgi:hypothetical protein